MDIISSSVNDDTIRWHENSGRANPTFTTTTIATSADSPYDVFAADMDNDGDLDILSASYSDNTIAWYESDIDVSRSNAPYKNIAQVDDDYTAISSTSVTFAPGETVKTFTVTVKEDLISENDEAVQVVLSNPTNATLGDSSGIVVITDDETTVWTATDIVTDADNALSLIHI